MEVGIKYENLCIACLCPTESIQHRKGTKSLSDKMPQPVDIRQPLTLGMQCWHVDNRNKTAILAEVEVTNGSPAWTPSNYG